MAADPITAIANAIASIGAVAKPFIDEGIAQKYDQEHKDRMFKYAVIMGATSPDPSKLDHFMRELLAEAGCAVGSMDDRVIRCPVDIFDKLVSEVSQGIANEKKLAKIEFKRD